MLMVLEEYYFTIEITIRIDFLFALLLVFVLVELMQNVYITNRLIAYVIISISAILFN